MKLYFCKLIFVDEVPEISGSIILSDPVVPNNPETEKFHFECHVPYQTLTDDGARFLVTWLFDGTKVCKIIRHCPILIHA